MNNVDNQEFKILRSSFANIFDDRSRLDSILQEEGRAGWKLVEKLDITLATIAGIGAGFIILRVMLPEVF